MITISSRDHDRALDKFSYEVSEELRSLDLSANEVADELRALNCTLAAIAISNNHEGARLHLERVAEEGIAARHHRTRSKPHPAYRYPTTAGS